MKSTLLKTLGSLAAVTLLLGANASAAQSDSQNKAEKVAAQQTVGAAKNLVSDVRNALGLEGPHLVVPEPSHSLLAMIGGLALLVRRRR